MKKILFLGTHGQKNWGDELLLHVFVHQLEPVAGTFYINSYDPEQTAAYLQKENVTVFNTKTERLKLLGYLFRCDALVFGGGNILKELYTAYGGERYATLGAVDSLTRVASLLGKPMYLCNIGVGPLDTDQGRQMAARIVQRAELTTVRDSESYRTLKSLQLSKPYELTSDAVFSTGRSYFGLGGNRRTRSIQDIGSVREIGINLCRNISNNDNWGYFIGRLAQGILWLHKQNPKLRFTGIPMQFDVAGNNDAAALQELENILRQTAPSIMFETAKPGSLQELANTINKLDVFIAERLHSLILALVIGVPVVALEYDIKVTGVIGDLGLKKYSVNINSKFGKDRIPGILQTIASDYNQAIVDCRKAYIAGNTNATTSFAVVKQLLLKEG